ncbi:MAG: GTPase HflX [Ruminococcaceae bacterium]|nr:GTPase HflX [Oscillospiraceae bacterium]
MTNITETEKLPRAVLCAVDTGEFDMDYSMDELESLAETAGAEVIAHFVQKAKAFEAATCIGTGKLAELAEFCENNEIDMVIFNHELTASQMRNIENATDVDVIDRTTLILDIFAQRARSAEGRLQVELAQLKYRLPRLSGMGRVLSRQGGGIGSRGPGEAKLETDKRYIRGRIQKLEKQLKELSKRREYAHARRKKDGVTTVAIVGYTNVGKSTLLNALTEAGVLAENMLFATLDPTSRALELPDGRTVMLIDTVGLVSRLPHNLVEAFKSTLEEAINADLILNVCDITSPAVEEQIRITKDLLAELGGETIPLITVANKCDMLRAETVALGEKSVFISAKTGYGFEKLLSAISCGLKPTVKRVKLLVPYSDAGILSFVRNNGKVFEETYELDGICADVMIDLTVFDRIEKYIME